MSYVCSRAISVLRASTRPAVAFAASLALTSPAVAQRAESGYQYTFRIQTGDDEPTTGRAWVAGDQTRLELDRTTDSAGRTSRSRTPRAMDDQDGYLLVTDRGRTLMAVSPAKREYSTTTVDEFENMIGKAMEMADKVLTMEVSDVDVTRRRLGPGGPVARQSTRRGRVSATYVARIGVLGFTARTEHQMQADYWVAPDIALPRNPLAEFFLGIPMILAQHDNDLNTRMAAGRRTLVGDGTPLKIVVTNASRDPDGSHDTTTVSYEITSLTRVRVDPTLFAAPQGFTKIDGFRWSVGNKRRRWDAKGGVEQLQSLSAFEP